MWLRALVEQKCIHILPPVRPHHITGKLLLAFQDRVAGGQPTLLSVTTDDGNRACDLPSIHGFFEAFNAL